MKSKDLQNVVLSKYQKGDTPTEIYHDLNGGVGLTTIKRWCRMIRQCGSIQLLGTRGDSRTIRTEQNIRKVKNRLRRTKRGISSRILSRDLGISETSGIKQKRKFPQKVMVWLGACSKGITPLVIFDKGTVNHESYIKKALPAALRNGNKVFGDNWTFQQDGAKPHQHHLTQQWCEANFPSFINKDRWSANSPDLNPLDYSIWEELLNAMDWSKIRSKATLIQRFDVL
ncbi:unnamed protein product [Adineta ricciae]|uniref:Uncharacterized protein n=1 Tax=Adineta ricciae TaxID=249248 RepID=A0A815U4J9_ADIRI|nr:unnamed protein product [Adineta ricciae]CAF1511760.1 unnamed protein product [Adineta ricciae]